MKRLLFFTLCALLSFGYVTPITCMDDRDDNSEYSDENDDSSSDSSRDESDSQNEYAHDATPVDDIAITPLPRNGLLSEAQQTGVFIALASGVSMYIAWRAAWARYDACYNAGYGVQTVTSFPLVIGIGAYITYDYIWKSLSEVLINRISTRTNTPHEQTSNEYKTARNFTGTLVVKAWLCYLAYYFNVI